MITLSSLPRAIMHVDCDAFFASCEQAINPKLKGKPVITGKERGIAASMSYEAKRRGVTRAMRLSEVKKVCPDCVILPNDYETYSLISKRLFEILRRFTPDVEEYSIDEAFAEITGLRRIYRTSYQNISLKIKETIENELGLTVSVGLAPTKILAKICSSHQKPSGFTCVKGNELHKFLPHISVKKVCGFGPNSTALLNKHGIHTIYDFVSRSEKFTKKILGKIGSELWYELRGQQVYSISKEPNKHQTTLSKVKTFTPPSNNKDFVKAQLLRNFESAFMKLRKHRLKTKEVAILLRNHEFKGSSITAKLSRATSSTMEAVPIISQLLDCLFMPSTRYRQTGIILFNLKLDSETQMDLFEDPCKIESLNQLSLSSDRINQKFGKHAIHLGSTHLLTRFNQHLGDRGDHPKRKLQLLKGETFRQRLNIPLWNIQIKNSD